MTPLFTIGLILFLSAEGLVYWADGATRGKW